MIRPNRAKTWIAACALLPLAACGKGGESQDETYTVRTPSPTPSASPTNAEAPGPEATAQPISRPAGFITCIKRSLKTIHYMVRPFKVYT
ncbi:hypothetical protein QCF01_15550, partial [Staphylococcus aureus]|nr:hypothetical protein [Staphylococcus aureus]